MGADEHKTIDAEALRALKHDIKNQLSSIIMSVEQLRYDITEAPEDCAFYIDTISASCTNINNLLDSAEEESPKDRESESR